MKAFLLGASLAVLVAGCAQQGELKITAVGTQAIQQAPADLAKAQLLLSRGEYALAIDAYRKAVRYDPGNAAAYNGLAIAYDQLGRHDLSRQNYELALAHAPLEAKYYRNLARSLERQGLKNEAARILAQLDSGGAAENVTRRKNVRSLAQIASDETAALANRVTGMIGPHLERLSMGEVLLETGRGTAVAQPGRSITIAIPAVATVTSELPAKTKKDGHSVTVAIPDALPFDTVKAASVDTSGPDQSIADIPLAALDSGTALQPTNKQEPMLLATAAADSGELLELAFTPATKTQPACDALAQPRWPGEFDIVQSGTGIKVFTGDFASARLGRKATIDLPLFYPASSNLPLNDAQRGNVCSLHMADSAPGHEMILSGLWVGWPVETGRSV